VSRSVCHLNNAYTFSNLQDYGSFLSLTYRIRCLDTTARSYALRETSARLKKWRKPLFEKVDRRELMAKEKEKDRERERERERERKRETDRKTWERFHRNRAGPVPCQRTEARRNQTDIRVLARVSGRSRVHTQFSRGATFQTEVQRREPQLRFICGRESLP